MFRCPFYKYSFCSLSNILSSWFQYEALKFVSFPTQVLAKACKVIPVMLMGKVVSGNKYPLFDWATAAQLGVGTSIFLLSNHDGKLSVISSCSVNSSQRFWRWSDNYLFWSLVFDGLHDFRFLHFQLAIRSLQVQNELHGNDVWRQRLFMLVHLLVAYFSRYAIYSIFFLIDFVRILC